MDGGTGTADWANYRISDNGVTVSLATGTGTGGHAEGDTLSNIENLQSSNFADALTGDANSNTLKGRGGGDTLNGGNGNDTLNGGDGDDLLIGGIGADGFRFLALSDSTVASAGQDTIKDFSGTGGELDQLDLSAILTSGHYTSGGGLTGSVGEVISKSKGANTLVLADVDGDGAADFAILLTGAISLSEADFIFV